MAGWRRPLARSWVSHSTRWSLWWSRRRRGNSHPLPPPLHHLLKLHRSGQFYYIYQLFTIKDQFFLQTHNNQRLYRLVFAGVLEGLARHTADDEGKSMIFFFCKKQTEKIWGSAQTCSCRRRQSNHGGWRRWGTWTAATWSWQMLVWYDRQNIFWEASLFVKGWLLIFTFHTDQWSALCFIHSQSPYSHSWH